MTFSRGEYYGQLATSVVRASALPALSVVDGWAMTAGAPALSANEHYDDLYRGPNRGHASRAVATVAFNLACRANASG